MISEINLIRWSGHQGRRRGPRWLVAPPQIFSAYLLICKQTDYGEDISELILQLRDVDDDPQPLSEVFGCVCLNLVKSWC